VKTLALEGPGVEIESPANSRTMGRGRLEEAHGLRVAGLAEEAPAVPEHERVDDQPQLVDEVVLQ
jgi:hypothetical protein